jgi:predicted enzyme related to lactoylglutathione lyase
MDFNSILIGSQDPKRLAAYYRKVFGDPTMEVEEFCGWQIGTGWVTVGPHDEVKGANAQPGRLIWNIETPDVASEFARLRDAGASVVREPYEPEGADGGMLIATFADPDGNLFQLLSPM